MKTNNKGNKIYEDDRKLDNNLNNYKTAVKKKATK